MGAESVLVAEDDPGMLALLRYRLQLEGYEVITVTDGQSALQAIREMHPSVCLLDRGLPDMDGLEVLEHVRNDDRTADARVVILSGHGPDRDSEKLASIQPDGYLQKPVEPDVIVQCVADQIASNTSFDLSVVRSWLHDEELVRAYVRRHFLDICEELLQQLRAAAEQGDTKGCASIAHRLAGSLANLGARRAVDCLRDIERAAIRGEIEDIESAVRTCQQAARRLTIWVDEEERDNE